MLKTLLVEDDTDKSRKILRALSDVEGFDVNAVDRVTTLNEAKLRLRTVSYDLLVLDIAIPVRLDEEPVGDGGLQLLNEILDRTGYRMPTHIIGVTQHQHLLAEAERQFSQRLLTIVYYNDMSEGWAFPLQARARHMIVAKDDRDAVSDDYQCDLAVVCALPSPELEAVLRLDWGWQQRYVAGDDTIYHHGIFESGGQKRTVWAADAARMGMPASSVLSTKMIFQFRPRFIAMAGITAGVPKRARFGDILAADPAFDWGSGKWEMDAAGSLVFQPAAYHLPLSPALRNKLRAMAANKQAMLHIQQDWPADVPDHSLELKCGPVASGASVLADGSTLEQIMTRQRDLVGVEMETYGVFVAATEAPRPKPLAFSIKSVVDFAAPDKDDRFQKYAAFTSAQALKYFSENYLFDG